MKKLLPVLLLLPILGLVAASTDEARHNTIDADVGWTELGSLLNEGPLVARLHGEGQHDFRFDPVTIPVGDTYSIDMVGASDRSIARFDLEQTAALQTEVSVGFENIVNNIVGDVTVTTKYEGDVTYRTTLPAASLLKLGTVTSTTGAWGPTYHRICEMGNCIIIVDPPETTIQVVDQPGVDVPFLYLIVEFSVDDPGLVEAEAVRFGG